MVLAVLSAEGIKKKRQQICELLTDVIVMQYSRLEGVADKTWKILSVSA